MGTVQTSPVPGDSTRHADLSNGQVFIQKTDGWFQFYLQAGAYTLPALATPFLGTNDTLSNTYGPVPVAFRIAAGDRPQALPAGAVAGIATGAPVPEGADSVVPIEDATERDGGLVAQPPPGVRFADISQVVVFHEKTKDAIKALLRQSGMVISEVH